MHIICTELKLASSCTFSAPIQDASIKISEINFPSHGLILQYNSFGMFSYLIQWRMKAQLTALQEKDQRERADANQKNRPTNQPKEDGRERTSAPSKSIYGLFDNDGRLDVFNMRKLVYERGKEGFTFVISVVRRSQ